MCPNNKNAARLVVIYEKSNIMSAKLSVALSVLQTVCFLIASPVAVGSAVLPVQGLHNLPVRNRGTEKSIAHFLAHFCAGNTGVRQIKVKSQKVKHF